VRINAYRGFMSLPTIVAVMTCVQHNGPRVRIKQT